MMMFQVSAAFIISSSLGAKVFPVLVGQLVETCTILYCTVLYRWGSWWRPGPWRSTTSASPSWPCVPPSSPRPISSSGGPALSGDVVFVALYCHNHTNKTINTVIGNDYLWNTYLIHVSKYMYLRIGI